MTPSDPESAAEPVAGDEALRAEVVVLRERVRELEDVLDAIGSGRADGLVVGLPGTERVVTLAGADLPFRVMIENLGDGAATLAVDGDVLFANRQLAQLLGVDVGALVGHDLRAWITAGDHALLDGLLDVEVGETRRAEIGLDTLDGSRRGLVAVTAVSVDGLPVVCCVVTDVTEQRHLEQQLGAERRRAERRAERLKVAREVNDTIVQGLVAAEMAIDLGRSSQARTLVSATSLHARELIGELVGETLLAGMAVRTAAATSRAGESR